MARWMKDRRTKYLVCPKCGKRELVNKSCQIRLCHSCGCIPMIKSTKKEKGINKKL